MKKYSKQSLRHRRSTNAMPIIIFFHDLYKSKYVQASRNLGNRKFWVFCEDRWRKNFTGSMMQFWQCCIFYHIRYHYASQGIKLFETSAKNAKIKSSLQIFLFHDIYIYIYTCGRGQLFYRMEHSCVNEESEKYN